MKKIIFSILLLIVLVPLFASAQSDGAVTPPDSGTAPDTSTSIPSLTPTSTEALAPTSIAPRPTPPRPITQTKPKIVAPVYVPEPIVIETSSEEKRDVTTAAGVAAGAVVLLFFVSNMGKKKENKKDDRKCANIKKIMEDKLSELTDLKSQLQELAQRETLEQIKNIAAGTKTEKLITFIENRQEEYARLKELYEKCITNLGRTKTKFVLHGGFNKERGFIEEGFFQETLKDTPNDVKVLLVYFAEREEMFQLRMEQGKGQFNKNKGSKNLDIKTASENTFIEDCIWADIIFLGGGRTTKLMEALKKYQNLDQVFSGKVIAGDSAGANALGYLFYSKSSKEIGEGLKIIPFKVIVHYADGTPNPLADIQPEIETLFLHEYETIVKYY